MAADELLRKGAAIYKETNCKLRVITSHLSNLLEKTGYKAISVPKSKIMNDEKFVSLHKLAADLANIGKIEGSLLVTPEVGVGVNWGTVLTDAIYVLKIFLIHFNHNLFYLKKSKYYLVK
ncbi:MAG: hypothetical protein ACXVHT_05525 [Methanobacterium sp.]